MPSTEVALQKAHGTLTDWGWAALSLHTQNQFLTAQQTSSNKDKWVKWQVVQKNLCD